MVHAMEPPFGLDLECFPQKTNIGGGGVNFNS